MFVYLFVCTLRFANFAKGKWSNHDSKNCSEIRTVTWSVIWLWKLQFTILIFFTTLYYRVIAPSHFLCMQFKLVSVSCIDPDQFSMSHVFSPEMYDSLLLGSHQTIISTFPCISHHEHLHDEYKHLKPKRSTANPEHMANEINKDLYRGWL